MTFDRSEIEKVKDCLLTLLEECSITEYIELAQTALDILTGTNKVKEAIEAVEK